MYRTRLHLPVFLAGVAAAALQYAGALKSTPLGGVAPVDLTWLAGACVLGLLPFLLARASGWRCDPAVLASLACFAALAGWAVLGGLWSAGADGLAAKLYDLLLFGPVALLIGFCVGLHAHALAGFCGAVVLIALGVGGSVAIGLADGGMVLGGAADTDLLRVQYQIAGLSVASAGAVGLVQVVRTRGARRLFWLAVVLGCGLAALLPGGRLALLALALTALAAPGLFLWRSGRGGAAVLWVLCGSACVLAGVLTLLAAPEMGEGMRTLERLNAADLGEQSLRLPLWRAALDLAGTAAPFGLGTGAFPIAAGYGDWRGRHPHNHALEALVELGLPGGLLFAGVWGCALCAALRHRTTHAPVRLAMIAALVLPVALSIMVSTDLGNRMAWLALGLLLSLGARVSA